MAFLVLLIPFLLSACSSTAYLVDAGVGQWKLFNRERPVEEVLASPYTPKSTKDAILTVMAAKKFAVEGLGLKATKNYSSYVQLDTEFVSWAVSASDPLKLEEKKWKFPIVGEIPYLGFFQKAKAEAFAKTMSEASPKPDVWVRGVPAFSSLGWFADPLYSSMIIGGERDIADVVIHESLHATIWVGNSVDFNEKLANFVGLEGSLRYLQQAHPDGEMLNKAKRLVAGEKIFGLFIREAIARYKAEVKTISDKENFYAHLADSYAEFYSKQSGPADKLPAKFLHWNNAALLAYANYYSDYSVFEEMLAKCNADLSRFVRWIVQIRNEPGRFESAPEESLRERVKLESCVN